MLIGPVLVLLIVLLFYKRDITPAWNPPIRPPQAWTPPAPPAPAAPLPTAATKQDPERPPFDLNDVFRRPS
jgi:hypothetical protein